MIERRLVMAMRWLAKRKLSTPMTARTGSTTWKYTTASTAMVTLSAVMTDWDGMSTTSTRRLTRTTLSTTGMRKTTPGPRASPMTRPNRKKTARWYSGMTTNTLRANTTRTGGTTRALSHCRRLLVDIAVSRDPSHCVGDQDLLRSGPRDADPSQCYRAWAVAQKGGTPEPGQTTCKAVPAWSLTGRPEYGEAPGVGTRHLLQESGSEIRRLGRSANGAPLGRHWCLRGLLSEVLPGGCAAQIAEASRRRPISSHEKPSSIKTSSVCCPSSGAVAAATAGVSLNRTGVPTTSPPVPSSDPRTRYPFSHPDGSAATA